MGPTSYCLGPMLCSSSDVSRIVGNEMCLITTPIECFHRHTNFFHERTSVVGKKSSKESVGPNNYTSGPMLCSSSVVPMLIKSVLISAPIWSCKCLMNLQVLSVHRVVMGPWVLPVTV